MKKIIDYFHLNRLGGLELFFAFFPILSQYNFGKIYVGIIALIIMDIYSLSRKNRPLLFKPLLYFLVFFVIHSTIIIAFYDGNVFGFLQYVITIVSIFLITPVLKYEKMIGSVYIVAIISMAGLLYHFSLFISGSMAEIHPLTLPFFPEFSDESRAMEILTRPSSFYWEPATYISFMIIPMFFSLIERKYLLTFVIVFLNLLSGSTNGIALSFSMLLFYVLTQDTAMKIKIAVVVSGFLMAYFLMTSEIFEVGVEKMNNTEFGANQRLHNGPELLSVMPLEHIVMGMPASDVTEYYNSNSFTKNSDIIPLATGDVYVSDFWRVIAKYGIIGLVLYINIYLWFVRKERKTWPYVFALMIAMFSQSVFPGYIFAVQMIILLSFVKSNKPLFRL